MISSAHGLRLVLLKQKLFNSPISTVRIANPLFEEVKPLFVEANFWYSGSLSCVSCHSVDVTISPAQLDLSSYAGIMAGSRRADAESKGTDILGDGNWESSLLYEFISTDKADIPGHAEIDL